MARMWRHAPQFHARIGGVLYLLIGAAYLNVFSREQLEAMALLSVNTHSVGFAVALMFFGCSCVALGYLTITASFPRPWAC